MFLINICLSILKKINYCQKILRFHPSHEDHWMCMFVPFQQILEERAGQYQNYLMSLNRMSIFASHGDISEITVFSQVSEGSVDIFLEIIPP